MKNLLKTQITTSDSGYQLITRERTEKLELLNHLITNLAHAIVVCGPDGVGKSRLLKCFQETTMESWMFCWVKGDSKLSLEKIQNLIAETITQNMPDLKFQSLENVYDRMASWNMKVVLMVDNAGSLVPGLIEKIIAYSEGKSVLRVIFALTHSELYLKNGTDPAIDDCYQIEIPPLSEKQCGEFLEYLSTLPRPRIQFSAINESMVAALYRETHGIPGSILTQLPAAEDKNKMDYSKLILIGAVAGLIILALGVQWWSSRPKNKSTETVSAETKQPNSPKIQPDLDTAKLSPQVIQPKALVQESAPQLPNEPQKPEVTFNTAKTDIIRNDIVNDSRNRVLTEQDFTRDVSGLQTPNPNPGSEQVDQAQTVDEATVPDQAQTVVTPIPLDEGGHWLMNQPVENYTLQLMALSKQQVIVDVIQRHQELGQNLRYLKTKTKSGKDRFLLLYGSFSNPEQAKSESKNLPKELQKTWMRKVGAVQSEIKGAEQIPALQ